MGEAQTPGHAELERHRQCRPTPRVSPRCARSAPALDAFEPINIQFTSGTTGNPKGATLTHHNIVNNARFIAAAMRFTEHDALCIPVPLYHCFGMVLAVLACVVDAARRWSSPARASIRSTTLAAVAAERCTALHGVPTMFIAELDHPDFASFDLSSAAHRHHGRLAVPDRDDEARRQRDAHARGHDRLRHDRDQPGVVPERDHRSARAPRHDRRPHPAAPRGQDRRRRRPHRAGRREGRAVHARLLGDAGLLGRPGAHARGGAATAGCTPATSRPSTPRATATSSAASRTC